MKDVFLNFDPGYVNKVEGKCGQFTKDTSQIKLVVLTSQNKEITVAKADYDIGKLANDYMDKKVKIIYPLKTEQTDEDQDC